MVEPEANPVTGDKVHAEQARGVQVALATKKRLSSGWHPVIRESLAARRQVWKAVRLGPLPHLQGEAGQDTFHV